MLQGCYKETAAMEFRLKAVCDVFCVRVVDESARWRGRTWFEEDDRLVAGELCGVDLQHLEPSRHFLQNAHVRVHVMAARLTSA